MCQAVNHNIKEILYAFNVKNHNIIKIFHKIRFLVLMSSLISRHWSCIYFLQPELNSIELKVLSTDTLLSFPYLMIFLFSFHVGNHFITCETKEHPKNERTTQAISLKSRFPLISIKLHIRVKVLFFI